MRTAGVAGLTVGATVGLAAGLAVGGMPAGAAAQTAGNVLRQFQQSAPQTAPQPAPAPDLMPAQPPQRFLKEGQRVHVTGFHVIATSFPEATLQAVLASYVGRDLTLGDLQEAAARIAGYYRDHDRLARAYLPRQTISGGIVTIQVLEAHLGTVTVDPASHARLDHDLAQSYVLARNPAGAPLRPGAVADGIADLSSIPGVAATGVLEAGSAPGATDVHLKLTEAPLVTGFALVDNGAPREIGTVRGIGVAQLNDPSGHGERLTATTMKTEYASYGQLSFGLPLSYSGLWLEASGSLLGYQVPGSYNISTPSGDAGTAGLTLSYPLLRTGSAVLALSTGYTHAWTHDFTAGIETSANRIDKLTEGLAGTVKDGFLGGGIISLDTRFTVGRLDLSDNADNQATDRATARTGGNFAKWTFAVSRDQPLWQGGDALASLSGQFATKNLDSTEQFSLGGPNGVRAYPVNQGSGDEGALLTLEVGHRPVKDLRVAAFWDGGWVVQHVNTWDGWAGVGSPHNRYLLQGIGVTARWQPVDWLSAQATVATRIGADAGRNASGLDADNRHQGTRAWLQLVATF